MKKHTKNATEIANLRHQAEGIVDSTKHYQTRKAPHESKERNRSLLLQASMDGFWLVDRRGRLLEVNQTYCGMSGYTVEELLTMDIYDLEAAETADASATHLQKVMTLGEDRFESRHRRKDGSIFDVEVSVQYQPDEGGQFLAFLHDISDRKHAEELLRSSEEKLRHLVWDMQVGVLLQGPDSEIVLSNPKALELLGINEEQLLGKTSFDPDWNVIHENGSPFPGSTHPVPQAIATRLSVRDVIMGVYRPTRGDRVWLLVNAEPQLNNDGTVQQVVCTFIDITKRKRAEAALHQLNEELEDRVKIRTEELLTSNAALQKAEEKYRMVADLTYDWEFWLDQNDKMLYCSPSCERITGYKASAFVKNPGLLLNIIHPDDLKAFQFHKQMEDFAHDAILEIQYRIIRSDGTVRWIGHVCQPTYNETGNFTGIRGSNRDITVRKEMEQLIKTSEQKYRLLSENITDGIFIYKNGLFEYFNKAMSHIFGYDDIELEVLNMNQLILPDYLEEIENYLTLNAPLNQIKKVEIDCIKKDHSIISVEILFNYIANERVIYGVVHDITERKQIQKNMVGAIIQTEEKERAYFSKELHDGLGPLLSTIKLYLQWSQRPKSNKSQEEIILKAEEILEEALTTVKEISNKLSPHLLANYGLTSAIHSFVDKLEQTSAIRIVFHSNATRRLDLEIETAVYRTIIECVNNTIKHARANNIYIFLRDSGSALHLQYQDDGIGFDLAEALTSQKGLGMVNIQNRIQNIGGKITMSSKPNHGVDYQIIVNL